MKTPAKKARSDAGMKGKALTEAQKVEVARWLIDENVSYEEARARMADCFGVFVKSASTLSDFYHSFALPWKYSRAKNFAAEFAQLQKGEFKPALLKRVEQLAFELSVNQTVDIKALKAFVKMLTDSEKVELQKGNLRLAIDKFKQSLKSDVEKGLDALQAELKGNDEALRLFHRMKAIVMQRVEAAK